MKTMSLVMLGCIASAALVSAAPMTYFGQDVNNLPLLSPDGDNPTRLTNHPNADFAASRFLSRLAGVSTETFENYAPGSSPTTLTFGPDTAALSGSRTIYDVPTNTMNGTFPISGNRFLLLAALSAGFFAIDFNAPQAAFGFYGTDLGEAATLQVVLVTGSGLRTPVTVPLTVPQPSAGVLYFGVIDIENPFSRIEFDRVGSSADGFAFDDLTIGEIQQVHAEPASLGIGLYPGAYAGLQINGTTGATYAIECTTNLCTANCTSQWTALTNIVLLASPYLWLDPDSVTKYGRRFYRAVTFE